MAQKMTIFGVGPLVAGSGIVTLIGAGLLTSRYPQYCLIPVVPYALLVALGIAMIIIGITIKYISVVTVYRAFSTGQLATTGPYAWSSNPIYAAYIFFTFPGIAFLFGSWPMLAASLVTYAVFNLVIGKETAFLRDKFGSDFARYQSTTNELLFRPPQKSKP